MVLTVLGKNTRWEMAKIVRKPRRVQNNVLASLKLKFKYELQGHLICLYNRYEYRNDRYFQRGVPPTVPKHKIEWWENKSNCTIVRVFKLINMFQKFITKGKENCCKRYNYKQKWCNIFHLCRQGEVYWPLLWLCHSKKIKVLFFIYPPKNKKQNKPRQPNKTNNWTKTNTTVWRELQYWNYSRPQFRKLATFVARIVKDLNQNIYSCLMIIGPSVHTELQMKMTLVKKCADTSLLCYTSNGRGFPWETCKDHISNRKRSL